MASKNGHVEVVKLLLAHHAQVDLQDVVSGFVHLYHLN